MPNEELWTVQRTLAWCTEYLERHGDEHPSRSAEWLMSNATGMSRQTGNDKKNGYENKSDDVCKKSNCPVAVLVLGNWNNETDQANFQDPAFQQKMMEGIYNGILTYWDIPVQG